MLITLLVLVSSATLTGHAQVGPEAPIKLNTLWEMQLGTDYTSTTDPAERNLHPYVGIFYVLSGTSDSANNSIPGVVPLYRLLNSSKTDHMDSPVAGEGGYDTEGSIGYMWSNGSAKPGLSPLTRFYDNQPQSANAGDHATGIDESPIAHPQSFPYYALEGALGFGYARYPGTDLSLASVQGGGVEAKSNAATGCAVWEWWWNGIQFINDYDYGRQLASAAYYPGGGAPVLNSLQETGDKYGFGHPDVLNRDTAHPSPCISLNTSGNTQSSAAVPLDWIPSNFGGGIDNPVIYPDMTLGKTLTLDWIGPDGIDRNWPVGLYQVVITSPPSMSGDFTVEAPTAYLNPQFNSYFYYTASSQTFTQVSTSSIHALSDTTGYQVPGAGTGPQAVILAAGTDPTSPAMGVFINSPNAGFVFYDESTGGCTDSLSNVTCQYQSNFAKWGVNYFSTITPSPWTFKTWIMTDTLQNVEAYINQLNSWKVTSR